MNEKLWNEFLKNPPPKKEKETLGEAVVAIVEETKQQLVEKNPCKLPNRGDIAEGIVAAAIAAKMLNRVNGEIAQVTAQEVFNLIKELQGNTYNTRVLDFNNENEDDISFSISIPKKAFVALTDPSLIECLQGEYEGAVKYVNSTPMHKFATRLAANGKSNKIEIIAAGTKDQKGTKVDIFISVDGRQTANRVSLKVKGGDQFKQKTGRDFTVQEAFWSPLGIDVGEAEADYTAIVNNIPIGSPFYSREEIDEGEYMTMAQNAFKKTYDLAYKKLEALLDENNKEAGFVKKLAEYITEGATGTEAEFMELIKILPGDFKRARFGKKFNRKIQEADLFPVKVSGQSYPTFRIMMRDEDGNESVVVQFRARAERASSKSKKYGKRYGVLMRNYLETGPGLFELAKI